MSIHKGGRGPGHIARVQGGGSGGPAKSLDFSTALPSGVTFSRGSSATYYDSAGVLQTASSNVARIDYNPATLVSRGLLIEEARTNLMLRSDAFDNASWSKGAATITANNTTAPDGTSGADKITTSAGAAGNATQTSASSTADIHTCSIFVKAGSGVTWVCLYVQSNSVNRRTWFNISAGTKGTETASTGTITDCGNGWYRITCTSAANIVATEGQCRIDMVDANGSQTFAGAAGTEFVYIWGGQLELGAFATSYIATAGSTVARSADSASMTGTDFSSWYNQSEGTFVSETECAGISAAAFAGQVSNAGNTNYIDVFRFQPATGTFLVSDASVSQVVLNAGAGQAAASNVFVKAAFAYKVNDFAGCRNGGTVATDTSGSVPTVDRLWIGNSDGSYRLNGHIKSINYYNTRLPDASLQTLTA